MLLAVVASHGYGVIEQLRDRSGGRSRSRRGRSIRRSTGSSGGPARKHVDDSRGAPEKGSSPDRVAASSSARGQSGGHSRARRTSCWHDVARTARGRAGEARRAAAPAGADRSRPRDHLRCDPEAQARLGDQVELAQTFANDLPASMSRRSAAGSFVLLVPVGRPSPRARWRRRNSAARHHGRGEPRTRTRGCGPDGGVRNAVLKFVAAPEALCFSGAASACVPDD